MKKVFFTGFGLQRISGHIAPSTNVHMKGEKLFFPDEVHHNLVRDVACAEPLEGLFINVPGVLIEE